jgi:hypothetical protein
MTSEQPNDICNAKALCFLYIRKLIFWLSKQFYLSNGGAMCFVWGRNGITWLPWQCQTTYSDEKRAWSSALPAYKKARNITTHEIKFQRQQWWMYWSSALPAYKKARNITTHEIKFQRQQWWMYQKCYAPCTFANFYYNVTIQTWQRSEMLSYI